MKRFFKYSMFILACHLFSLNALGQSVDSLLTELKHAKSDSVKVIILNAIVDMSPNPENILTYSEQMIKLSDRKGALKTSTDTFFLRNLATAVSNKGYVLNLKGDVIKGLEFFEKSMYLSEQLNDTAEVASAMINIGSIFDVQGNLTKALENYHKALKIFEKLNNKARIGICFINIGNVHKKLKAMPLAMSYYTKSLKLLTETNNQKGLAHALNSIGSIYDEELKTEKALEYFNKSMAIREKNNDMGGVAQSLNNIGVAYKRTGDHKNAETYLLKSLEIYKEVNDKKGFANTLDNIAQVYLLKGEVNNAYHKAKLGFEMAKELGSPKLIKNSARTMKNIFKAQNKYKEAMVMYDLEIKMRDSIDNQETQKAGIKQQLQYTYEKKEIETKAEQNKKDALTKEKLKQKEKERNYFIAGFALVLVLALFILRGYRQKQKDNMIIIAQKQLVDAKQKEILDSIHYAKRIQLALLPSEKYIQKNLKA